MAERPDGNPVPDPGLVALGSIDPAGISHFRLFQQGIGANNAVCANPHTLFQDRSGKDGGTSFNFGIPADEDPIQPQKEYAFFQAEGESIQESSPGWTGAIETPPSIRWAACSSSAGLPVSRPAASCAGSAQQARPGLSPIQTQAFFS